ncbi:hypothetical protein J6590_060057 [Homalodisca vitripennis]|nr:hypothetical protein J6590_060057 [Homalodisca vitripennis]
MYSACPCGRTGHMTPQLKPRWSACIVLVDRTVKRDKLKCISVESGAAVGGGDEVRVGEGMRDAAQQQ